MEERIRKDRTIREMVEKFTWNYVGRYPDDNELCGATHTRVVRLWRERGCETERHDGNYVCIIFNFSNILRQNGRGSGVAPYEDSCDYEKLTTGLWDRWSKHGRIGESWISTWPALPRRIILFFPLFSLPLSLFRYSIYRTRFLSSTHDSAHFLFSRAKHRPVRNRGIVR